MKQSFAVIILASVLAFSCHKSSGDSTPSPTASAAATQVLQIGSSASPGNNTVEVDSNISAGGSTVFTFHADRTGALQLFPGSEVGVNCNISDLSTSMTLSGPEYQNIALNLPQQVQVQNGEDYSIKLTLGPNSCAGFSFVFQAYWVTQGQ